MNVSNSTAANIELQEQLQADLERKELRFNHSLSTVALFGLVVLPLIPGSLSFASIVAHFPDLLGIPSWLAYMIALFTAVGVEVLGLVVIKLALRMRKFNHKAQGYTVEPAPLGQGIAAAALYLGVVLSLVVLLKVMPAMSIWALIPLACLGAIADWAFALQGDQSEREADLRRQLAADAVERDQHSEIARLNAAVKELQQHIADHEIDAAALQERVEHGQRVNAEQLNTFNSERQQLQRQIEQLTTQLIAQQSANVQPVIEQSGEKFERSTVLDTGRQIAIEQKRLGKAERQQKLLNILFTELNNSPSDELNKSALGERLGVKHTTISRDIEELIEAQRLSVNGHIQVM